LSRPASPRGRDRGVAPRDLRHGRFLPHHQPRGSASHDGSTVASITALAPLPHPRFSRFFAQIKQDLGFGIYVPDCDTTACSFSAATQAGSTDPILDQPLLDFYAGYQVARAAPTSRA
jgi:hypothetical protein